MQITKEQWAEVEANLSSAWGVVELEIDGYKINLRVAREKSLKYVVMIYVNGVMDGKWLSPDSDADETKRFFRKISKYALKPKARAELIKIYGGKRCPKADLARFNQQYSYFSPVWSNVKDMRRHFVKNNQSIEVVHIGYEPC
ncbi:hypothetical protein ACO0LD_03230 [Undibacterium sp. Ji83W]|uniref:hypothetical protein n=1 Tax=Undibacterium sp. Ji83W TaxID=3413043 RepID=UPI003BEFF34D